MKVNSILQLRTDWVGTLTGLSGSLLLALQSPLGWWMFAVSNGAWMVFAYRKNVHSLLVLQLGFCCTTAIGLYNTQVIQA